MNGATDSRIQSGVFRTLKPTSCCTIGKTKSIAVPAARHVRGYPLLSRYTDRIGFDAMAEFGAVQAVCRRRYRGASCAAGLVWGDPPGLKCDDVGPISGVGKNFRGTRVNMTGVMVNCTLNKMAPRWAELGYTSLEDAMSSGEVQVYYLHGLPDVGYERGGEWGKREALKALLEEGYRADKIAKWLRKHEP